MKKILSLSFVFTLFVLGISSIPSHKADAAPSVSVSASPSSVAHGGHSTIRWTSSGATTCDRVDSSGVVITSNIGTSSSLGFDSGSLYSTTTFYIRCTAPDVSPKCNSYYPTCFISDTKVIMSDGSTKNIQDVKVGDILKGEKTNNKVLGLHQPELNGKLYSFNGGRYFVTEEHPFKTTDGWKSINPKKTALENIGIEVSPLNVGDTLVTEKGNVLLKSIDSKEGKAGTDLFNFLLDGDHTYYADGYLVHNKQQCLLPDNTISCGSNNFCVVGDGEVSYTGGVCPMACDSFDYVDGSTGCDSGYISICNGSAIQCVTNLSACGYEVDLCAAYGGKCSSKFTNDTICYTLETKSQCQSHSSCQWLLCAL